MPLRWLCYYRNSTNVIKFLIYRISLTRLLNIKLLRGSAHGVSSTTKACIRNTDRPNLHSFITLQATQHHQSIGKIQSMLKDVFQIHFSTGAISTAHGDKSQIILLIPIKISITKWKRLNWLWPMKPLINAKMINDECGLTSARGWIFPS